MVSNLKQKYALQGTIKDNLSEIKKSTLKMERCNYIEEKIQCEISTHFSQLQPHLFCTYLPNLFTFIFDFQSYSLKCARELIKKIDQLDSVSSYSVSRDGAGTSEISTDI